MTIPNNIFATIDKDKELFNEIRIETKNFDKLVSKLFFNFHLYSSIVSFYRLEDTTDMVEAVLLNFIAKEENIGTQIAKINNTYHIAYTLPSEELVALLMGKPSNIVVLNTDAAKMGALLALSSQKTKRTKTDILSETLFLSKNML